jgi:mono/diheme cytochrome c family protein
MSERMSVPLPGCILRVVVIVVLATCVGVGAGIGVTRSVGAGNRPADDSAQKIEQGNKLFHARCGYCHLAGGTGTIMLGRRLGKDRALLGMRTDLSVEYIKKITRVGINSMPPHNRIELPDSELDLIAVYLTRPASVRGAENSGSSGNAHE